MALCKCGKVFETSRSLSSHARFCNKYVKKEKISKYLKTDKSYICECSKIFYKAQSLNAHFAYCEIHRNGEKPIDKFNTYRGWNKGKTKKTDSRILASSKELQNTWKLKSLEDRSWSLEQKRNLSTKLKGKTGGYRQNSNRSIGGYYINEGKKVWLDSSYEKRFVEQLDNRKIKWIRNITRFSYSFNQSTYNYTPDFYLPTYQIYIEVKGWVKDKDLAKWEQFPKLLKIVKLDELKRLENDETLDWMN